MRPRILGWLTIPVLAGLLASPAQAGQAGFTGSIAGTVTDDTQASIPDAAVIVTNAATNQSITVRTDRSGTYFAPNLPPGTYRIDINVTGFKHLVRSGITLQIDQRDRVDLTLETGVLAETIDV